MNLAWIRSLGFAALVALNATQAQAAAPPLAGACQIPSLSLTRTGSAPHVVPTAQVRHVDRADITFQGKQTLDGGFELEAKGGGNFTFRKTTRPDGQFKLDLEVPGDKVTIAMHETGLSIVRNKRQVVVNFDAREDQSLDAARALLAGSRAVNLTRTAAAAIESSDDDSGASIGLMLSDALVGALSGDPGAPGRAARHLSRTARNGIRRIAATDCYNVWETRVLRASFEYTSCVNSFSTWNPTRNLCAFRWVLQVESYWFSLISCSGFDKF